MLNAFYPLYALIKNDIDLKGHFPLCNGRTERGLEDLMSEEVVERGRAYMWNVYRDDAERVLEPCLAVAPDIGKLFDFLIFRGVKRISSHDERH